MSGKKLKNNQAADKIVDNKNKKAISDSVVKKSENTLINEDVKVETRKTYTIAAEKNDLEKQNISSNKNGGSVGLKTSNVKHNFDNQVAKDTKREKANQVKNGFDSLQNKTSNDFNFSPPKKTNFVKIFTIAFISLDIAFMLFFFITLTLLLTHTIVWSKVYTIITFSVIIANFPFLIYMLVSMLRTTNSNNKR